MSIFVLKNNFPFRKRRFDVVVLKSDLLSSNSFPLTVPELQSNRQRQGHQDDLEGFNDLDKTPVRFGANLTQIDKFFSIFLLYFLYNFYICYEDKNNIARFSIPWIYLVANCRVIS